MRLSRINGVTVDILGEYETVFVSHRDVPGALASIIACVADDGVNIAFMKTYRSERGGMAYTVLEMDDAPADAVPREARAADARYLGAPHPHSRATRPGGQESSPYLFASGEQLLGLCEKHGASIGGIMHSREESLFPTDCDKSMARVLEVMVSRRLVPSSVRRPSLGGFIGGEAQRLAQASDSAVAELAGAPLTQAVTRAMAVSSKTPPWASSSRLPQRGRRAWSRAALSPRARRSDSMTTQSRRPFWCAAAVGTPALDQRECGRAEGGCQAEVGSAAAAMAAAALVQLLGGSPKQALNAARRQLRWATCWALCATPLAGLSRLRAEIAMPLAWPAHSRRPELSMAGIAASVSFDEAAVGHALRVGRMLPA